MVHEFDRRLEAAMCDHWALPPDVDVIRRPEFEYLRSRRNSCRYNAALRTDPTWSNHEDLVREFVHAVGQNQSEWRIGAPSYSKGLEAAVEAAGYALEAEADAWSIDVNATRPRLPANIRIERVETISQLKDLKIVFHNAFDRFEEDETDPLDEELSRCTGSTHRTVRLVAYDARTQEPLSSGALDLFPDLGLGFMWGGSTIDSARGRGLYSALVTARMDVARSHNLERVGMYALRHTSGAIAEKQGFTRHGTCHFWM